MTEAEALLALKAHIESATPTTNNFALLVYCADGSVELRTDVTLEEYMAMGRVADCDCQLIKCVCTEARKHDKRCIYRIAMTCAIPIACEDHGQDVCPVCDPCICLMLANGITVDDLKKR
jgi:hypothetical protein